MTDRYKLVHYYKPDIDEWELLDREKDPLEVKNFFADPEYADTVAELKSELQRLREEVGDTEEPPRSAYGQQPFESEKSFEEAKAKTKTRAKEKTKARAKEKSDAKVNKDS